MVDIDQIGARRTSIIKTMIGSAIGFIQFYLRDTPCPRGQKPIHIAIVEPDPSRLDIAHHKYQCVDCGPIKRNVISLQPRGLAQY